MFTPISLMKAPCLLLCLSLPFALSRLGDEVEGGIESDVSFAANETHYMAKNEVQIYHSNEDPIVDLNDFELNESHDDSLPFDLLHGHFEGNETTLVPLHPEDLVIFQDESDNTTIQDKRRLQDPIQSAKRVMIRNNCLTQSFWLAIIYYSTDRQKLVHKGWYNIPAGHKIAFDDVGQNSYSMYAMSHDRKFNWGGNSNSKYCPNKRCYRDFTLGNGNGFAYLSCNSGGGGPQPVPSPVPSPTPPPVSVSSRAQQWVDAHNTRRRAIHGDLGKSYVPLSWSSVLANSAQRYAEKLAASTKSTCYIAHGYQGDSYGGENIAANWGSSEYNFESPEAVLTRWFEDEADLPWPENGHYTQVAWRGSRFTGCGEARRKYDGNKWCKVQVCRYIAPGNCNIGSKNLRSLMADDSSPCGDQIPKA